MFYGRISDVYLGVITLTVTLILFNSVNSTAGPEFHIGTARLGGFNGIPGIPPLNLPGNKTAVIDLEGALAGFAGCLFANWGNFVSPTIFGLSQSAQIIIWVLVGGRATLIGPVVGCIGIQWLSTALGANQPSGGSDLWAKIFANAPLILGLILIAFVLLVPKGIVPTLGDWGLALLRLRGRRASKRLEPTAAE
jgi:branched-chain amino acid transport system permease protein